MRFQHSWLSAIITTALSATALSGCNTSTSSSSGGGSDSSDSTTTYSSLSGLAADGYLVNAKVCLDLDGDGVCGSDEPSTTTGSSGEFTLSEITQDQIDSSAVLVETIANETIDTDSPFEFITQNYTLSAPAGSTFISPFTTMIKHEMDGGASLDNALTSLQSQLNTSVDLQVDYIAAQASSNYTTEEQSEFASMHQNARVIANIIAQQMNTLSTSATEQGLSTAELLTVINEEIADILPQINDQVDAASANSFDPSVIASTLSDSYIALREDNLVAKLAEKQASDSTVNTDVYALLVGGGFSWFWSDFAENEARDLRYGDLELSAGAVSQLEYYYDYTSLLFADYTAPSTTEIILSTTGWVEHQDTLTSVSQDADTSVVTFEKSISELNQTVTALQIDISGLNMRSVLDRAGGSGDWAGVVNENATFSNNSYAYALTKVFVDAGYYSFDTANSCSTSTYGDWSEACNTLVSNGAFLTQFPDLISDGTDRSGGEDLTDLIPVLEIAGGHVFAQLMTSGEVYYYQLTSNTPTLTLLPYNGSWSDILVNGEVLYEVTFPKNNYDSVTTTWTLFSSVNHAFYITEFENQLRTAWYTEKVEAGETDYVFDQTARDSILNNYSQPLNLASCLSGLSDSGYSMSYGDTVNYTMQRTVPWRSNSLEIVDYEIKYLGSTWSWLASSNVTDMPSDFSSGGLVKYLLTESSNGDVAYYEDRYTENTEFSGLEYGSVGFAPGSTEDTSGDVNVIHPTSTSDSSVLLGVQTALGSVTQADYNEVNEAVDGAVISDLSTERYERYQTYLGKEVVVTEAGIFEACKVYQVTDWESTEKGQDTDLVWLINRGMVKQEKSEEETGISLELDATSVPEYE
ncbi:hypothetical protein N9R79_04400 [Vibrio sp.]|nr:hypothetical protein [Vibrio sp.]